MTYLVLGTSLRDVPSLSAPTQSELLLSGPPVWIYRIPGAFSRVSLVTNLEETTPANFEDGSPNAARIDFSAPGRLNVVTTSPTAKFLLVHNLYYTGWVAEVDGQKRPVLHAEKLFLAVEVPSKTHRVSFYFAPFTSQNLGDALETVVSHRTNSSRR